MEGHVAGCDIFGDAYIIPMIDILTEISLRYSAQLVYLPSKLELKHWQKSALERSDRPLRTLEGLQRGSREASLICNGSLSSRTSYLVGSDTYLETETSTAVDPGEWKYKDSGDDRYEGEENNILVKWRRGLGLDEKKTSTGITDVRSD